MRAVVWNGPESMAVEELQAPAPRAGSVVVEVAAAGICGSDLSAFQGRMGLSLPGQIRGHEFSGVVVDTDAGDSDWLGVPVAVYPLVTCGTCRPCRTGAENLCPDMVTLGIQQPGAFAERVAVPVRNLVALPGDADLVTASLAEPLAQAVHDIRLAQRDSPVDRVLVIGCGSIGTLVVNAARLLGISDIVVLEPNTARHATAQDAGASTVLASVDDVDRVIRDSGEFAAVFDVVGTVATRRDTIRWTERGGTAIFVGLHDNETSLPWHDLLRREVTVRCANASNRGDFEVAVRWLTDGSVRFTGIHLASLNDGVDMFSALVSGMAPAGLKVVLSPRG